MALRAMITKEAMIIIATIVKHQIATQGKGSFTTTLNCVKTWKRRRRRLGDLLGAELLDERLRQSSFPK